MFKYSKSQLKDSVGTAIGIEFVLEGRISHGNAIESVPKLRELLQEIERIHVTDLIAINTHHLEHWDSIGVRHLIGHVVKLNKGLVEKKRVPISLVGDPKVDTYFAVRDKFPDIINTSLLPWYSATEEFLKQAL